MGAVVEQDIYSQSAAEFGYIGEAWQYKVRKAKAAEEADNPYWKTLDLSVQNTVVRPISYNEAKSIIEEYEWLGCMPAISTHYYGIFFQKIGGGGMITVVA